MKIFPSHPDLQLFNQIAIFLFMVGVTDLFYLIIKSKILKRDIRKKEHSWQGFWILSILTWLFTWGVYLLDELYDFSLLN